MQRQQSTYTAPDFNNTQYMSLNDATRADQDTVAINPTNDSAFDPVEGQQSTYTDLDLNPPDNNACQEICKSSHDTKGLLMVSRNNGSESTSKHKPVSDNVVDFETIEYEELP